MASLTKEIASNCDEFTKNWTADLSASMVSIEKRSTSQAARHASYRRLTSLQAWRSYVLEPSLDASAFSFFLEAQNDALISHINAFMGAPRVALKALRSLLENTLCMIYYMDHPVELRLWGVGKHKAGFSELRAYVIKHPDFLNTEAAESVTGASLLKNEYAVLSAAVHGSSKNFRMTEDGKMPALWNSSAAKLSQWQTREKRTILAINLVLLTLFRTKLKGSANPQLRRSLAFSIPANKDAKIKEHLDVTIKRK